MRVSILILVAVMFSGCSWFEAGSVNEDRNEFSRETEESNNAEVSTTALNDDSSKACWDAFSVTIEDLKSSSSFKPFLDFYKNHSHCMDAGVSEGMEGAISKALDEKWENIGHLKAFFHSDPDFKEFFFKNIGAYVSATEAHLERVVKKAKTQCPNGAEHLCTELSEASSKALEYSKSQ